MQIEKKIVNAIVHSNGWKLCKKTACFFIIRDKEGKTVSFTLHETPAYYFFSMFDVYYAMTTYPWINGNRNPYIGLTPEEIYIKCDLETSI